MTNVWCVRADFGKHANDFVGGGYAAIGWMNTRDLKAVGAREELYPMYRAAYPEHTSNVVVGAQVGQIARFLLEMQPGDYVITPAIETKKLHYGVLQEKPAYFHFDKSDGCPFRHRRPVDWEKAPANRYDFSIPFQNTMRSSLTVFSVSQRDEFFSHIGRDDLVKIRPAAKYDPVRVVLDQILELDDKEFEVLITHLLTALGFEGTAHTGKTGDGGVDATGEMSIAGIAATKVYVQAKRYKLKSKISANTVKKLRQSIPSTGQGIFITTADYQKAAYEVADEIGFPRIGLIDGRQLVDLLSQYWSGIPEDFQERLGLRQGLVRI